MAPTTQLPQFFPLPAKEDLGSLQPQRHGTGGNIFTGQAPTRPRIRLFAFGTRLKHKLAASMREAVKTYDDLAQDYLQMVAPDSSVKVTDAKRV